MKRLFISQPMKDKTNEEIMAVKEKAIEKAKDILGCDVEVVGSFFTNFHDLHIDIKPLWLLGASIQALSKADVVIFCDGWQDARGCRIEHECAVEYGIKIIK